MDYTLDLIRRCPKLESAKDDIIKFYDILKNAFEGGSKLLIAGNGGSAADSEHIAGELMKGFVLSRRPSADFISSLNNIKTEIKQKDIAEEGAVDFLAANLQRALPAIALTGHNALSTACINDINGDIVFAQQVFGFAAKGDVFLGISTSGNAKNVFYAALTARAQGLKVLALTGRDGGKLSKIADAAIIVNESETYKIQELHLPIYHTICLMLEEYFFGIEAGGGK